MQTSPLDRVGRSVASRPKTAARAADHGDFARHLGTEAAATGSAASVTTLAAVSLLLEVQEVDADGRPGRRRAAARRGHALLDRLETLRLDLLAGVVTPQRLRALSDALREERVQADDPAIDAVLAEIELRAEVEMAKLAPEAGRSAPLQDVSFAGKSMG